MNIGIFYGSNSGGAQEASELIAETLRSGGHIVTVVNVKNAVPSMIAGYDLTIFGSCTWELVTPQKRLEGTLQEHFLKFREQLKGASFAGKSFAIFGLGDSSYTSFCSAANHLEILVRQIGGTLVCDTMRVDKYYFNLTANRKKVRQWARSLSALKLPQPIISK